mgnify:CR=1 FL=1
MTSGEGDRPGCQDKAASSSAVLILLRPGMSRFLASAYNSSKVRWSRNGRVLSATSSGWAENC